MESDRVSIVSGEFQMIENPTGFFAKSERAVYTMLFGLSAHSIFEGLAIGLQDVSSKLWLLAGTGNEPIYNNYSLLVKITFFKPIKIS